MDDVGADLGIALAMASSATQKAVAANVAVYGEIGLAGEVRAVAHASLREKEAQKLGYGELVSPSEHKTLKDALAVLKK